MAGPLSALEYIDQSWLSVAVLIHANYDDRRRAEWERIIKTATKIYGYDATSAAIVDHVNQQVMR